MYLRQVPRRRSQSERRFVGGDDTAHDGVLSSALIG